MYVAKVKLIFRIQIYETREKLYLGMELLMGGRLTDLIQQVHRGEKSLSDLEASTLFKAILNGLEFIHENGVMHRDLKPANIIFKDQSDLSSLKIVDFGLSQKYIVGDGIDRHCGTKVYMAPEVILKQHEYNKSVDVWAVGIILYEVLTGG